MRSEKRFHLHGVLCSGEGDMQHVHSPLFPEVIFVIFFFIL